MKQELQQLNQDVCELILEHPPNLTNAPQLLCDAVFAYPSLGGKGLRAALLAWYCGVHAGSHASALYAAAAVEIYHSWTLVHDDIIDHDDLRRGRPSAHRLVSDRARLDFPQLPNAITDEFGIHLAILAGDVQQAWANAFLLIGIRRGIPAEIGLAILDRLNTMVNPALLAGEALDVKFELIPFEHLQPAAIKKMMELKTGVLLRFAAETGAMLGVGTADHQHPEIRTAGEMAMNAGIAFQLHDDILGLFGDEEKLGKPLGSDLRRGKRTLLFAEAIARSSPVARGRLLQLLGNPEATGDALNQAREIVTESGALRAVESQAQAAIAQARAASNSLPRNRYRLLLEQWLDYVTTRRH